MSVDDNEVLDFEEEEIINSPQLGNREHIINGPIVRTLFKLAWPVMIGNTCLLYTSDAADE